MSKWIIVILITTLTLSAYSQNDCDCKNVLEQLTIKVEKEYPGFSEKTKDSLAYTSFKKQLLESASGFNNDECIGILKKYINYFKDGHLAINKKVSGNINYQTNLIDIDLNNFNKYLEESRDSVEGIWTSGGYKVGIIKKNNIYTAFIISSQNSSWKAKENKFNIKENGVAVYYRGDHSPVDDTCIIHKNCIIYFKNSGAAFVKEFPAPQLTGEKITEVLNELEGFYIKPISEKTVLLRIPSFDYPYTERIELLIESNKQLLNQYENLIIDLRGNGGGTDYSYRPILPYLYTNPVRYLSGEYLVTQTLIDGLLNWVNTADKNKYADEIESVKSDIKRMEGNIGKYIPYSEEGNFGFTKQDSVYSYPKKVAILTDKGCGSSTEKFLLDSKQSKKVKIFGTPTYGAVDYVSLREFKLNCNNYSLYMPTVRMMRLPDYPLDNIGIQPDIYLDKYIKDWVLYAKEYLEN
jgi:hypothetical protein